MRDDGAGERELRAAGLRVTRPRLAVLGAVHAHAHATTDELIGAARERLAPLSHQAVYDALRVLTDSGLVRRFQPQGSVARYEARVGDNHHHLVCRGCGGISDVDCRTGEAPCLTPLDAGGFVVDEAEVTYWGLCAACAATAGHDGALPPQTTPLTEHPSATERQIVD